MITGLIQPKKWRKFIAVGLVGVTAAVGTTCLALRALPNLSENLDATALVAAGFILPNGAVETVLHGADKDDNAQPEQKPDPEQQDSAVVSAAADSGEQEPSSETESKSKHKKWSGTSAPIEELVIENTGVRFGSVYVKNDNDYTAIDIEEELEKKPDLSIQKDGTPQVLIYHTHTSESFLTEESDTFYSDMPTRSSKESENVVAVGEAIAAQLEAAGIGVIHDTTIHDESYNGSYSRSAETIAANLEEYPTIQVTLDIHRDAMISKEGVHYKPTVSINGKKAAQIMIISGCDDDGTLGFPDWEYNLRLATRLQQSCAAIHENFARPLSFGPHIYNENMTHNSLLVEFGTEVNTVEEVTYSGKLFGDALVSVLQQCTA